MLRRSTLLFLACSLSLSAQASLEKAAQLYERSPNNVQQYTKIAEELIEDKLYSSALPFAKEYLTSAGKINVNEIDELVDTLVPYTGIRQFETMPVNVLSRTKAPMLRYILAKKYFRLGKYNDALAELGDNIPRKHSAKPFALFLEGSILSMTQKYLQANNVYKECVDVAESALGKEKDPHRIRQLTITRDYCLVGLPRSDFANKNYESAILGYLDLSKSSYIWPEVLFEEAWASFYSKDYNRTLGKLVTYKAPILTWMFNPEVEVLKALTYMELCLWQDTKKVVDDFYSKFEAPSEEFNRFLEKNSKDYRYYYNLANTMVQNRLASNDLTTMVLRNVLRDPTFMELWQAMERGKEEVETIKSVRSASFRHFLVNNLNETLLSQRDLIGAYVRKGLLNYQEQLERAFEGMSYIKLEVLGKRKSEILSDTGNADRARGNIKYLKRNDKQYFWDFNGEFWADELGDYAFALKSECRK